MRPPIGLLLLSAMPAVAGCRAKTVTRAAVLPVAAPVQFTDVTRAAGIRFVHNNGAAGAKWLPETMGSGCAFIDYDRDGRPDIFLVNSRDWTPGERRQGKFTGSAHSARKQTSALYHNRRDGTFDDVTKKGHLDIPIFGQGVCAG